MRKLYLLALGLAFVACSPQAITMLVERKTVPDCGVDLDGKSVCVIYLQNGSEKDSLFSGNYSDGLAQGIEQQFFSGEKAVEVFSLKAEDGVDYSAKDSLVRFVMETNSDVIMLLDRPSSIEGAPQNKDAYISKLYVYDSMNKGDVVVPLVSTNHVTSLDADRNSFASDAQYIGYIQSRKFIPEWNAEPYTFLYFESIDNNWYNAAVAAYEKRFDAAIDAWMELAANRKDKMKSSCASYNIALACHLIGQQDLALEWLDKSDKDYPISLSTGLRKRIIAAK